MQKIVLGIIVVLVIVGAGIAFVVLNPPQAGDSRSRNPVSAGNRVSTSPAQPELPDVAFLQGLADRHPEGKTYVAELLKAQKSLQDEDSGNDFSATLNMAVNLNLLGEKEMALEWYQKALKADPTNLLGLNNLANLYSDLGQYDKAEETWLFLIDTYPQKTQSWRSLGYLYRYRLHKSSADIEALFVRGLTATNNSPDLLNWLLSYFLETGQNEKFVEYANRSNANPDSF